MTKNVLLILSYLYICFQLYLINEYDSINNDLNQIIEKLIESCR